MKQIRNTQSKKDILEIFNHSQTALSHNDIQKKVGDTINRVTIYRILERLEAEGQIHKIINVDGVVNYAKCHNCTSSKEHQHNHIHFSCEVCKSLTCIEYEMPVINLPKSYVAKEFNFVISGICESCNV